VVTQRNDVEDRRAMVWLQENKEPEGVSGALFIGQGLGQMRWNDLAMIPRQKWKESGRFISQFVAIWGFSSKSLGRRYENRGIISRGLLQGYENGCTGRGEAKAVRLGFRSVEAKFGFWRQGRVATGMEEEGVRLGWTGAGHACTREEAGCWAGGLGGGLKKKNVGWVVAHAERKGQAGCTGRNTRQAELEEKIGPTG
jgi:hypothetical protein